MVVTYYPTLAEDLKRAGEILTKGKADLKDSALPPEYQEVAGGTIYGADTYAAYKLLESFVQAIEELQATDKNLSTALMQRENDILSLCNILDVQAEEDLESTVIRLKNENLALRMNLRHHGDNVP